MVEIEEHDIERVDRNVTTQSSTPNFMSPLTFLARASFWRSTVFRNRLETMWVKAWECIVLIEIDITELECRTHLNQVISEE